MKSIFNATCARLMFVVVILMVFVGASNKAFAIVNNPLIWADVPDVSVLRVDDNYYMVSTTMHMNPGIPVMQSKDLVQWRTVSYVYETLGNNDKLNLENGQNAYGKGSWASSLRYRDGYYYVLTPSYTTNKTHLYKTKDIVNGPWTEIQLPFFHDPSLFFDDDGTAWIIYGTGEIRYVQLNDDASGVKAGGKSGLMNINIKAASGSNDFYLMQEGSQMFKHNGEYYLVVISFPAGKCRTEIVYRSKTLLGAYDGRIFIQNDGVAQGTLFDSPDGKWYAMLFKDSGPVGRIPYLVPTSWVDGWPVPDGGKAPATLNIDSEQIPGYGMVTSDNFDNETLPLEWQWNHNPDKSRWSLSANPGNMRITTGRVDQKLYNVKNTLTQRTIGPKCSGRILLDGTNMKDGDIAGLVALADTMGYVGLAKNGTSYAVAYYKEGSGGKTLVKSVPVSSSKVYLRIDFDLPMGSGTATFHYSEDGKSWKSFDGSLKLYYTLAMFMGYRFGLFNMATKTAGGSVDFDWFKIGVDANDEIWLDGAVEPVPQSPYGGVAATLPGKIETEHFDVNGVGSGNKSYKDNDAENQGDANFRTEDGVDIVLINPIDKAAGMAIGYTNEGEWLEYTVNVTKAGKYDLYVNVASGSESSALQFFVDDKAVTDVWTAPKTGSDWNTYEKAKIGEVEIDAGEHVVKMSIAKSFMNVDWFEFNEAGSEDSLGDSSNVTIRAARFANTENLNALKAEGKLQYFDMQGHRVNSVAAKSAGVYIVRTPSGKMLMMRIEK